MLLSIAATLVVASPTISTQSVIQTQVSSPAFPSRVGAGSDSSFIPLRAGVEGDQPVDVVMALGGTVAVVALRDSDSLEFYDVASGTRLGHVRVARPIDLDPTPDGTTVFVACSGTDRVCVVDVASRTLTASIGCARNPFQVTALSDNQRAIVACNLSPNAGRIQTVDRVSAQVLASATTDPLAPINSVVNIGAGIQLPTRIEFAVTPDDATVAVPSVIGNSIELFDATTLVSTARFASLGTQPYRAAASSDSSFFAVGSATGLPSTNRVYVVQSDGSSMRQDFVNLLGYNTDIAITPDSASILYGTAASIVKIDATSGQIVGSALSLANQWGNIEIANNGTHAIVSANVVSSIRLTDMATQIFWRFPSLAHIAVHQASSQVVAISPLTDEDITSIDLAGSPFELLWDRPLGVPEEVDAPQEIELTADGGRAVVTCPTSRNVAVMNLDNESLVSLIDVGGRCMGLAVSPVADLALVCVTDGQRLDVVDIATGQVVQSIPTVAQPQFTFFSPDGSRAVVAGSSTGTGEIEFFDVAGTSLTSSGQLSVPVEFWSEGHISPDGTKLSFIEFEKVTLIDMVTQSMIASIASPAITQDGRWATDSSRFTWSTNNIQTRVATLGTGSPTVQIYTAPTLTAGAAIGPNSEYLYQYVLGDFLRVIELSTGNLVQEVLIGPSPMPISSKTRPRWFQVIGDQLLVVRNDLAATICRVQLGGPATSVIENVSFPTEGTADVAFDLTRGRMLQPASTEGDGIRAIQYGGEWMVHCGPATPNSTGLPGSLRIEGSLVAGTDPILLEASDLPSLSFGLFLASRTPGVSNPGMGQGTLCLGGSILRLLSSVQSTGPLGRMTYGVAPTSLTLPAGIPQAGESIYFQTWFRDANPGPTSNFSDGVQVILR